MYCSTCLKIPMLNLICCTTDSGGKDHVYQKNISKACERNFTLKINAHHLWYVFLLIRKSTVNLNYYQTLVLGGKALNSLPEERRNEKGQMALVS